MCLLLVLVLGAANAEAIVRAGVGKVTIADA